MDRATFGTGDSETWGPCTGHPHDPRTDDDETPLADAIESAWADIESDGADWITDALARLIGEDRTPLDVHAAVRPELDTYGMSPGALLQVLFSREVVPDAALLTAAKTLREMLHAWGDGECEASAKKALAAAEVLASEYALPRFTLSLERAL